MESHFRHEKQDVKWKVSHGFIVAEVIARYLCREEKDDVPHVWEYYPSLFEEEQNRYEKWKEQRDFEEYKEKRRQYVAEYNRRRRQDM